MAGKPAARVGDPHTCPSSTILIPHVGGPVLPPGAPTVLIGGLPAARLGDQATCTGFDDTIVTGAFPVPIATKPAARIEDKTAHGGVIVGGCATVLIGLAGTSGNPWAGADACKAAAAGRNPPPGKTTPKGNPLPKGKTQQSYNNCGVESARQIINQANKTNVGQEELLQHAIEHGHASGSASDPFDYANGGTSYGSRQDLLSDYGVESTTLPGTMQNVEASVASGSGVIAAGDPAGTIWSGGTPGGGHAVLVTGVEYDDAGNVQNVIINDTGVGSNNCMRKIPAKKFEQFLKTHNKKINVTDKPIW